MRKIRQHKATKKEIESIMNLYGNQNHRPSFLGIEKTNNPEVSSLEKNQNAATSEGENSIQKTNTNASNNLKFRERLSV